MASFILLRLRARLARSIMRAAERACRTDRLACLLDLRAMRRADLDDKPFFLSNLLANLAFPLATTAALAAALAAALFALAAAKTAFARATFTLSAFFFIVNTL